MDEQRNTRISAVDNEPHTLDSVNWSEQLREQAYAYGAPAISGQLKVAPEDFVVIEIMDVEPTGDGEHTWLDITKTRCNTDAVAKALARFAGVAYRDVAYSGMKDFHAVTRQWFSVWRPKGAPLEWSEFALDGVQVHQVVKHARKIKRGTHRANQFCIKLSSLSLINPDSGLGCTVEQELERRLQLVRKLGVPNYFGEQRFGRNGNNMRQAVDALVHAKRIKDRNLRGLLLSSARSWLFNQCVSARIKNNTWQQLYMHEPANLNGTNSVFNADGSELESRRLSELDIHPTAPLWGDGADHSMAKCHDLHAVECAALQPFRALMTGLEKARLEYQRRPLRSVPANFSWQFERDENGHVHATVIRFELQSGQFATSVVRELLSETAVHNTAFAK